MRTLLILVVLSCAAIVTAAPSESSDDENWLKLSSEHFDVITSASERESMHVLVQLEQFRPHDPACARPRLRTQAADIYI